MASSCRMPSGELEPQEQSNCTYPHNAPWPICRNPSKARAAVLINISFVKSNDHRRIFPLEIVRKCVNCPRNLARSFYESSSAFWTCISRSTSIPVENLGRVEPSRAHDATRSCDQKMLPSVTCHLRLPSARAHCSARRAE